MSAPIGPCILIVPRRRSPWTTTLALTGFASISTITKNYDPSVTCFICMKFSIGRLTSLFPEKCRRVSSARQCRIAGDGSLGSGGCSPVLTVRRVLSSVPRSRYVNFLIRLGSSVASRDLSERIQTNRQFDDRSGSIPLQRDALLLLNDHEEILSKTQ